MQGSLRAIYILCCLFASLKRLLRCLICFNRGLWGMNVEIEINYVETQHVLFQHATGIGSVIASP